MQKKDMKEASRGFDPSLWGTEEVLQDKNYSKMSFLEVMGIWPNSGVLNYLLGWLVREALIYSVSTV